MNNVHAICMIALIAIVTMLLRFLPFLIFGKHKTSRFLLYLWKRQTLLSIVVGTACYMVLVQTGVLESLFI